MIDERLVVLDLLDGIGINKSCLYGHCYLLAKYYLQVEGLNAPDTRKKIFEWATAHKIWLDSDELNLNQIIYKAQNDKRPLRQKPMVGVSDAELRQIILRFDNTKTRRVALAILCYAKATMDEDGNFSISMTALANWLGYGRSALYEHMKELREYRFIEKQKQDGQIKSWNAKIKSKSGEYRLLIPVQKKVYDHVLRNNDIDELNKECFAPGSSAFRDIF
ncbi:MAG: hypothetical protein ACI4PM_01960 [Butyricicoccus sp.]